MTFTAAAPLRAWLANNLGLNPFFNGDTRSPRVRMSPRLTHPGNTRGGHTPRGACGCPRRCVYVPCALHLRSTLLCPRRVAGDGYTYDGCYGMNQVTPRDLSCSCYLPVIDSGPPPDPVPRAPSHVPRPSPERPPSPAPRPRPCYQLSYTNVCAHGRCSPPASTLCPTRKSAIGKTQISRTGSLTLRTAGTAWPSRGAQKKFVPNSRRRTASVTTRTA